MPWKSREAEQPGWNAMKESFWKQMVCERISCILEEDKEQRRKYYEEQTEILRKLDSGTAALCEKFIDRYAALAAMENETVYEAGFMDGLRLGRRVFGSGEV